MSTFEGKFENEEQFIATQKKNINSELVVVSEVVAFLVVMLLFSYIMSRIITFFKRKKNK